MSYILPELPYYYDALEPYFDTVTMTIHHKRHHQDYIKNLNKAIEGTDVENVDLEELIKNINHYSVTVRYNAGGHYNHSLFWKILSDTPQIAPEGKLAEEINIAFGGLDKLIAQINEIGLAKLGSGWVWLSVNKDGYLKISTTTNQDNPLMNIDSSNQGFPILGVDLWEHAYHLRYQNNRAEYLNNFWLILDWEVVEKNYEEALSKL